MSLSNLHPEELLDKDASGALSDAERALLEAHLSRCAACRFERAARADFAAEVGAADRGDEPYSSELLALALQSGATPGGRAPEPPVVDENAREGDDETESAPREVRRTSSPRRRRWSVWLVAAAATLAATAAVAGPRGGARLLLGVVGIDLEAAETAPPSSLPRAPAHTAAPIAPPPPVVPAPAPTAAIIDTGDTQTSALSVPPTAPVPPPRATSVSVSTPPRVAATPPAPAPPAVSSPSVLSPEPVAVVPPPAPPAPGAAALFDEANDARRAGRYARAIELLRELQARHPASREAQASHATLGRLLLDRGDPAGALASFDAYRRGGPAALDESVMIGRATALDRLGRTNEARAAWGDLLSAFPRSPYAAHARGRVESRP